MTLHNARQGQKDDDIYFNQHNIQDTQNNIENKLNIY